MSGKTTSSPKKRSGSQRDIRSYKKQKPSGNPSQEATQESSPNTALVEELTQSSKEIDIIPNTHQPDDNLPSFLKQNVFNFKEEKFSVLTNPQLQPLFNKEKGKINTSVVRRSWASSLLLAVKSFFTVVLEALVHVVNRNLILKHNKVAASSKRYYSTLASKEELIYFYSMIVHLENMWAPLNKDLHKNRGELFKSKLPTGVQYLGEKRFDAILSCIRPNNEEFDQLVSIINNTFILHIIPCQIHAFDETVYAYEPSILKDSIPVVYIPRKPHPNGLLSYKLCCKLEGQELPYTMIILPYYRFPKLSPNEALNNAIDLFQEKFPYQQIHIVADSAFGSFTEMKKLQTKNVIATFSMCSNEKPWLWTLLKHHTDLGNWNGAYQSNTVSSVEVDRGDNGKFRYHHLLTNAFAITQEQDNVSSSQDSNPSITPVKKTRYSKKYLNSLTVKALRDVCKTLEIKVPNGNKQQIINFIYDVTSGGSDLEDIFQELEDTQHPKSSAIHHDTYRENFNFIDIQNREWYGCYYRYSHSSWKSKLLLSIMEEISLNVFAIHNEMEVTTFTSFRNELAESFHSWCVEIGPLKKKGLKKK